MNTIGPYASQQLLLHAIKPLVESQLAQSRGIRTGIDLSVSDNTLTTDDEDPELPLEGDGPACTWPLGEILAARHDLQHSRIFNS